MDLKCKQSRDLYTGNLKIYSQLVHLKNFDEFGFWKLEILCRSVLVAGPVSSLRELSTDLQNTDFYF